MKHLIREIEILKQKYLTKRNSFANHKHEVKSKAARDFIETMDICIARLLTEYEMQRTELYFKGTLNEGLSGLSQQKTINI